jgi:hypothetical protein
MVAPNSSYSLIFSSCCVIGSGKTSLTSAGYDASLNAHMMIFAAFA